MVDLKKHLRWYAKRLMPAALRESRELSSYIRNEPEIGVAMRYTNFKMRAIDIGAHNGHYTLAFQKRAREVIAFEPVPYIAERLRRKFRNNVQVYCLAVSDASGTSDFFLPKIGSSIVDTRGSLREYANPGFELERISVSISTLDAFNLSDISIIKIDVEGNEKKTIDGATKTIELSRPVILVEIEDHHNPGKFWETVNFIHGFGYKGFFMIMEISGTSASFLLNDIKILKI